MRRRRYIPQRTTVFLGCEGKSERGYAALLSRLAQEAPGVHLHIHVELLQPGAGDPHALIQRAVQKIFEIERKRTAFRYKAVLLDLGVAQKNSEAARLAATAGIDHVIWQRPDHEGFLLRHLEGCQNLNPPAGTSINALRQKWPSYEKASTLVQLAERISMAGIEQACHIEPELNAFLREIGLITD